MPILLSAKTEISIPPEPVFEIGPITVTNTMVSAFVTTVILLLAAVAIRLFCIPRWRKDDEHISGFRLFIESMVNMFDSSAAEQTERYGGFVGPFYFALAGFIALGTLMEMTGLRPPTSDLNATLALGLLSFVLIFVFGFCKKRARRLIHYCNPINVISDVVVPFSLALRLFGSVFSGYVVMHLLYSLPVFAQVALPAVGSVIFTLFHAIIQSYIFMFLSMSFIGEAIE
ncbi:MAG: F0F1 ATP synthase subunit A [Clostridia bacterium]|nr:F0F1 ATP synthase subunit A [Clostridia bacterium]